MQCVILAGGLGTRIRAVAGDLPKSLLNINGKPFIHYQLAQLSRSKIKNVVLCIGYQGQKIRDYVGRGEAWDMSVRYVDEGDHLQGTGGALRLAADQGALDPVFALTYGDSFLPIDIAPIAAFFYTRPEPALMTVLRNEDRWDSSNVSFDGVRVTRYDKTASDKSNMIFIDYGLSLLRSVPLLAELPKERPCNIADYFKDLSGKGLLAGYEVTQRFYEIGSPAGLSDFKAYAMAHFS